MKKKAIALIILMGWVIFACTSWTNKEAKLQACFDYDKYALVPVEFDLNKMIGRPPESPEFVPRAQSSADTLAWKTFIAISWPDDGFGKPDSNVCLGAVNGRALWEGWHEVSEIFANESKEIVLNRTPWLVKEKSKRNGRSNRQFSLRLDDTRNYELDMLMRDSSKRISGHVPEVVDQNGNKTYFQSYYNDVMTDYVERSDIKSLEGIKKFVSHFPHVDDNFRLKVNLRRVKITRIHFPMFTPRDHPHIPVGIDSLIMRKESEGSIMIKVAWKVLAKGDVDDRFYTRSAVVKKDGRDIKVKVGLVAMHIAIKYSELPQWLWATFEHKDNVPEIVDGRVAADPNKEYSYYNIGYGDKVNNKVDSFGRTPLARLHPIGKSRRSLNKWIQDQMRRANSKSVWENYELVGSQWSSVPDIFPRNPKYIGEPRPFQLANSVIENFGQASSCMSCHGNAFISIPDAKGKSDSIPTNFAWAFKRLNESLND